MFHNHYYMKYLFVFIIVLLQTIKITAQFEKSNIDTIRTEKHLVTLQKDTVLDLPLYTYYKFSKPQNKYIKTYDSCFYCTDKYKSSLYRANMYYEGKRIYTSYFHDLAPDDSIETGNINAEIHYFDDYLLRISYFSNKIIDNIYLSEKGQSVVDLKAIVNVQNIDLKIYNSIFIEFYYSGRIKIIANLKSGYYISFHENTIVKEKGSYKDGKRYGFWRTYNEKGWIESEGEYLPEYKIVKIVYSEEQLDSMTIASKENIVFFDQEKRIYLKKGEWRYYDKQESLIKKELYKDGKVEETIKF